MNTKTDFDFDAFRIKLKKSFFGFTFEEGGNPNDPEDSPFFSITKEGFGCCNLYDPNYNPQCQKPGCIVVLIFNDRQMSMSLDGLLVVPTTLFEELIFVDMLRQILRFKLDTANKNREQQSILMLLSLILRVEEAVKQTDSIQLDVQLTHTKAVLNRKELINYFS